MLQSISLSGLEILDMGTGSGILAMECARQGANVTAADIDERAVATLRTLLREKKVKIEVFQSDLFSNISKRYDLIIFNPPYLPSGQNTSDTAVDGGMRGREIIERFLRFVPEHLEGGGYCLLVVSSLNTPEVLFQSFPNLYFEQVAAKRVFFEVLTVLKVKPK